MDIICVLLNSLDTMIGVLIGGLITFLAARHSTKKLINPIKLMLEGMEEAGFVKWTRDKKGEPISVTLQIHVKD